MILSRLIFVFSLINGCLLVCYSNRIFFSCCRLFKHITFFLLLHFGLNSYQIKWRLNNSWVGIFCSHGCFYWRIKFYYLYNFLYSTMNIFVIISYYFKYFELCFYLEEDIIIFHFITLRLSWYFHWKLNNFRTNDGIFKN